MHVAIALQKAIYEALIADAGLLAELGGAFVFDSVPINQDLPFVQFGKISSTDWSTNSDRGEEHEIAILIWSCHKGRKQLLDLAQICEDAITSLFGIHEGHHIIDMQLTETVSQHDVKSGNFKATLTFRCVTES